ncbi:MAG: tRNA uridine(34) 5-carboxymethylaminomethyl modification radical SAM/GNAT enzyme Elp3 [Patescibacteria group bacterium]|jgi:elongator complex protein 3
MNLAEKIVFSALKKLPKNELEFSVLKRALVKQFPTSKGTPDKTDLLKAYHSLLRKKSIKTSPAMEKLLTRRSVRTLSGVTIVTSLVKPYPCPGECIYCPLDVRMPKSYLADEPAASRALSLKFNPYEQMARRLESIERNGHPTDKIELIVKGGTWNAYALPYQYWFILQSFAAANGTKIKLKETSPFEKIKTELVKQQKINEKSKHRIIGLTLETRPDSISEKTLWQMREQGCTRLEIGVQHTDDKILKIIKRGHTIEQAKKATELARNFGFKTDFHLMPQLPGATPKSDLKMLREVFSDPGLRPDMIKIYPCTVVKGSELYDWLQQGKYHAYPTKDLVNIIKTFKSEVPRYVRISRLIRDIPGQHIEEGNRVTNLRQVIHEEMKNEGLVCRCLRCREAGHVDLTQIKDLTPKLFLEKYQTAGGTEYFLSFEDKKRQVVFAFCRLRIVSLKNKTAPFPAYIRELHTYGQLIRIGKKGSQSSQHQGLGKKLIIEAEKICKKNKIKNLAVISGVGVKDYYKKLGYKPDRTYLVKRWK